MTIIYIQRNDNPKYGYCTLIGSDLTPMLWPTECVWIVPGTVE